MGKGEPAGPTAVLAVMVLVLYAAAGSAFVLGRGTFTRSPDSAFASADFRPEDVVFDATAIPPKQGAERPPVDLAAAVAGGPEALARGRELFASTCAACHGPLGRGDGPAGASLNPPPRDFTRAAGWKNGTSLGAIFGTLSEGIPGTAMVAYDTLSPEDRFAVAHAVQSLGAFAHAPDTRAGLEALDARYHLTAGVREPNRAPVAAVMANMAREGR